MVFRINEVGRRSDTNELVVKINPRYYRPTEVDELQGDSSKAHLKLGWKPKISLDLMIEEMIKKDREIVFRISNPHN